MLTNNIVSFERLGPDLYCFVSHVNHLLGNEIELISILKVSGNSG